MVLLFRLIFFWVSQVFFVLSVRNFLQVNRLNIFAIDVYVSSVKYVVRIIEISYLIKVMIISFAIFVVVVLRVGFVTIFIWFRVSRFFCSVFVQFANRLWFVVNVIEIYRLRMVFLSVEMFTIRSIINVLFISVEFAVKLSIVSINVLYVN